MKNREILEIALQQSAYDCACQPEDFLKKENVIVHSVESKKARKYLKLPFSCQLVSYGNNIVASVSDEFEEITRSFIGKFSAEHCFETPNMHVLNDALQQNGQRICFMAEYFLPDVTKVAEKECRYEMRVLLPADFADLYLPQWSNAINEGSRNRDQLCVGAYDNGALVGLAGCSADCEKMWQIGIDVLPEYRRQGIAQALTSRLAVETLRREKVPFYCAAWSNLKSVRNALSCGFKPAWVEMTAKRTELVDEMKR